MVPDYLTGPPSMRGFWAVLVGLLVVGVLTLGGVLAASAEGDEAPPRTAADGQLEAPPRLTPPVPETCP